VRKKVRIVNFKRFLLSIFSILTMIALITAMFLNDGKAYSSVYEEKFNKVKIKEGDTIWEIALENKPEDYDTRKMVLDIIELNNLEKRNIYPGDIIKVPIKNKGD